MWYSDICKVEVGRIAENVWKKRRLGIQQATKGESV
jgi:hypothetical protein